MSTHPFRRAEFHVGELVPVARLVVLTLDLLTAEKVQVVLGAVPVREDRQNGIEIRLKSETKVGEE